MNKLSRFILITLGSATVAAFVSFAQETPKALTNADVINMVKAGLAEPAIVATIRSNPANFDLSPDALIKLHASKVTEDEMRAMMAASGKGAPATAPQTPDTPPPAAAAPPPTKKSRLPLISIVQNGAEQKLPLEKTQLAQTKNKPVSMAKLAGDTAMLQGMQATMNSATSEVARHMGSGPAGGALGQVGGAFSGILAQRKPEVTYVWAIPNPVSATVLSTDTPQVTLNFSNVPGINPDEFEPALVKLTPAQNALRLVGATRGKEDALSSSATDWEIYSGFVEDRVKIQSQKLGPGHYQISPATPLLPGEYGIVLRPVSKSKKFSGGDVARSQGDGLMFDSVWSFQVSAEEQ